MTPQFPLKENLSRLWSSLVVEALAQNGVKKVYASPGLRNAPILSACEAHPNIKLQMGIDERSQSFRALGHSLRKGELTAIICTSGSALAHYFPAIIEAYKSQIPLIIISADRPREKVFFDDNQCIDQVSFFSSYVKKDLNFGPPETDIPPSAIFSAVSYLCEQSLSFPYGPVHFNFPLREPLDHQKIAISEDYLTQSLSLIKDDFSSSYSQISELKISNSIKNEVKKSSKILLSVGYLPPYLRKSLKKFLKDIQIPKIIDVTSGLKFDFSIDDVVLPSLNHPEVLNYLKNNPPDIIFHLGGRMTSKEYYHFLEQLSCELIIVNDAPFLQDPSYKKNYHIQCRPDMALDFLTELFIGHQNWTELSSLKKMIHRKRELILSHEMSFPLLSLTLAEKLSPHQGLYIGNSTLIRSFDYYASTDSSNPLSIYTQRGASGIEGLNASYLGLLESFYEEKTENPPYLVIGDISFLHDQSSLMLFMDLQQPATIIVANNQNGGIFNLLPIKNDHLAIKNITTPHKMNFEYLCKYMNFDYERIENQEQLVKAIAVSKGKRILDVRIDNNVDENLYKQLRTINL